MCGGFVDYSFERERTNALWPFLLFVWQSRAGFSRACVEKLIEKGDEICAQGGIRGSGPPQRAKGHCQRGLVQRKKDPHTRHGWGKSKGSILSRGKGMVQDGSISKELKHPSIPSRGYLPKRVMDSFSLPYSSTWPCLAFGSFLCWPIVFGSPSKRLSSLWRVPSSIV